MYHVNDDVRCKASCKLVYDALSKLLKNHAFEDITITMLCDSATISRSTFYRHFDSIMDVILWETATEMHASFTEVPNQILDDLPAFTYNYYDYWIRHRTLLEDLVKIDRVDVFLKSLRSNLLKYWDGLMSGKNLSSRKQAYLFKIWSSVIWSILDTWILTGQRENAAELAKIHLINMNMPSNQDQTEP